MLFSFLRRFDPDLSDQQKDACSPVATVGARDTDTSDTPIQERIKKVITETLTSTSKKVTITFKTEAIPGLYVLLALYKNNVIAISEHDVQTIGEITKKNNWEDSPNRSLTITLTQDWFHKEADLTFKVGMVVKNMSPYLENIVPTKT